MRASDREGQGHEEFRPAARLGLGPDPSAVLVHDLPADVEPQPGALDALGALLLQPLEALEEAGRGSPRR